MSMNTANLRYDHLVVYCKLDIILIDFNLLSILYTERISLKLAVFSTNRVCP